MEKIRKTPHIHVQLYNFTAGSKHRNSNKEALRFSRCVACGQSGSACECFYLTGHKGQRD